MFPFQLNFCKKKYDLYDHSSLKRKFEKIDGLTKTTRPAGCIWLRDLWGEQKLSTGEIEWGL